MLKCSWPALIRRFSATTNDSNSAKAGQLLLPLSTVNIMRFFSHPRAFELINSSPPADLQDDVCSDDGQALTAKELEFLEFFESISEENQAALTRVAQYLEADPQALPLTKQTLEELFLSAKSPQ